MADVTREGFENRATESPYDHMSDDDQTFVAREFDIVPVDAAKSDDLDTDMSWSERHIGGGSVLCITDYGRHRDNCDTLGDFVDMVRDKIDDGFPSQYLKVMDDDKEKVAEKLVAVTRSNGYVVVPYFE
jgi:hypothetical protein